MITTIPPLLVQTTGVKDCRIKKHYTYELQEMELIEERQANWKGEGNNPRNPDSSINSITGAKILKGGGKKINSNELILQESFPGQHQT